MAQIAFSIRMDETLKRDFGKFCSDVGMPMSTAFVVFAKETLKDNRFPFVISPVPQLERELMPTEIKANAIAGARRERSEQIRLRAKKSWESMRAQVQEQYAERPEPTLDEINEWIAETRMEQREADSKGRLVHR